MERQHLLGDELVQNLLVESHTFEFEAELGMRKRLVGRVVQRRKVRLGERIFDSDALCWRKGEHALQQIDSHWVGVRIYALRRDRRLKGQAADVTARLFGLDRIYILSVWSPNDIGDQVELMDVVLTRKERLPTEQLGKYAANRPNIDSFRVLLP